MNQSSGFNSMYSGRNRKISDDIGTKIISNTVMAEINAFCERDNAIRNCKARQDAQTFSNEFIIGFFSGSTLISEISALNADPVKRALQNFFLLAHDWLVRFQFVGLYYVKNINEWTEKIMRLAESKAPDEFLADGDDSDNEDEPYDSDSNDDNDDRNSRIYDMIIEGESSSSSQKKNKRTKKISVDGESRKLYKERTLDVFYSVIAENLPFGVIPLHFNVNDFYGQYYLLENRRTMKRSIIFEPFDPDVVSQFEFEVIDAGVKFVVMDESPFNGRMNMNNEVVPLSPFIDLFLQSELIHEAETQIFDFNSMQVYKEEYAIAVPQQDAQLSSQPDSNLYSINSILGIKQMENVEREHFAMKNAADNINRLVMENSLSRSPTESGQPTIGMQRLMNNRRPQRVHFLKHIPKSVQIPNTTHTAPTHNIEQMRSKYDNDVCAVMSLPFIFYKPFGNHHNTSASTASHSSGFSSGGGGRESNSKLEFTQKLLDDETKLQHRFFNELLKNMYSKTMGKLDLGLFRGGGPTETSSNDGAKKKRTNLQSVPITKMSRDIGKKIEIAIDFDKVIVKNDDAVRNLLGYYQAGLIEGYIVRKFLYQNFDITDIDPMKDPIKNPYFNNSMNDGGNNESTTKKPKKAVRPNDKTTTSVNDEDDDNKKNKKKSKEKEKEKEKKKKKKKNEKDGKNDKDDD